MSNVEKRIINVTLREPVVLTPRFTGGRALLPKITFVDPAVEAWERYAYTRVEPDDFRELLRQSQALRDADLYPHTGIRTP